MNVACPHCGKPLEVQWEVFCYWPVVLDVNGKPRLGGDTPSFEGGECSECGQWVEPGELALPLAESTKRWDERIKATLRAARET